MECRDVRPLIEAYLGEQLLVETTEAMLAHLARCPACRAEVEGVQRIRTSVKSSFLNARELDARPEFLAALKKTMRERADKEPSGMTRRAWLAVAAGVAGVAIGGGAIWRSRSLANVKALGAIAVGDHRFCALDFKLEERPISLQDASKRFGGANLALATVEAAPNSGVHVLERHSCVYLGQRFAHIVVSYKGQPVSALIAEVEGSGLSVWGVGQAADSSGLATLETYDGFHVAAFEVNGHVAFFVSALSNDDLQAAARVMRSPISDALERA